MSHWASDFTVTYRNDCESSVYKMGLNAEFKYTSVTMGILRFQFASDGNTKQNLDLVSNGETCLMHTGRASNKL